MVGIDDLVRRRRGFGQDSKPAKRVNFLVGGKHAGGNRWAADSVESITATHEIASNLVGFAAVLKRDARCARLHVVNLNPVSLEKDFAAPPDPGLAQVLYNFVLRRHT